MYHFLLGNFLQNPTLTRTDFPPSVKQILRLYGNARITKLLINRIPLSEIYNTAFNFVSRGKWDERKKANGVDKLYHLSLSVYTDKGDFLLEKLTTISLQKLYKLPKETESREVDLSTIPPITLLDFINRAKNKIGNTQFFKYSGFDKNCAIFVQDVLGTHNIPFDDSFVHQPVKPLFDPSLRRIANTITDIADKSQILIGNGIQPKKMGTKYTIKYLK